MPPRMLQSGASFYHILSVAPDAPVRGTGFTSGGSSPGASAVPLPAPDAPIRAFVLTYSLRCLRRSSPWNRVHPRTIQSGGYCRASCRPGCSNPGRLFIVFSPLPPTLQSVAPGSPPDDPVWGLVQCFFPPQRLQSGPSFYRIFSAASDAPVRGTGFTPGRSSPGASAVLHSAPGRSNPVASFYRILCVASDAPVRGTGFTPGRSSPGASAVLLYAPDAPIRAVSLSYSLRRPGRSSPDRLFIVFSPLPRTLQSVAPGAPPDDPVRGLAPCFIPPRMLQSGASFCHILSAASDAPVRGTGFTPGRSSPGASAVLLSSPDAPIRGVFLSYSLRCLGRSSPWRRVHPRTIQSGR